MTTKLLTAIAAGAALALSSGAAFAADSTAATPAPAAPPAAAAPPAQHAATHHTARARSNNLPNAQDAAVDDLNARSLAAAQSGQTLAPPTDVPAAPAGSGPHGRAAKSRKSGA